ncbi:class I SAM-dependent methyltransferase [Ottowia sp. VDI28]|uniref:class I SAM-dependent methyltransferase n=1 Tax=Ottowia sp. VDI28 TaxID=3133968 RepID=UPI003C2DFC5F
MTTYLPELNISDLVHAVSAQDWSTIEEKIGIQQYERLGLDRALAIAADIYAQHGSLHGLKILDVGSNNGLISKVLSALGCHVVGIDNGDVDGQGLYSNLQSQINSSGFDFYQQDLANFIHLDKRSWDCILLLSVTHHWETGYAMSGRRRYSDDDIRRLMTELFRRTQRSIYYECPSDEPGFKPGFGIDFLMRYCEKIPKMRNIGRTVGPNGYPRDFFALDMG